MADDPAVSSKLSENQIWLRDMFFKLLGWGTVIAVIFVGWVLSADEPVFKLDGTGRQRQAAWGFAIIAPILYFCWVYAVCKLNRAVDRRSRIFSKNEIAAYLGVIGVVYLVLGILALI